MLKNKVIIVTGGSGLIGKAILGHISKNGGKAINADLQDSVDLENVEFAKCDITKDNDIDELIQTVVNKHGAIDGWVNNAYPRTKDWGNKFENISYDSWKENMDMHLGGYFQCCQKALESMKENKKGSLVNIASIYGIIAPDFNIYAGTDMTSPAAYAAIKGGIINLSRYLASYYGEHGIRVNCVSPGGIFDNQLPSFVANYEKKVPLRRMGTPEDIAPSVSFLLSDEAQYISGQNLVVDGGLTCL